jgi:hypothetical protein
VKPDIRYFSVSTARHAEEDNTRVSDALAKTFDVQKIAEDPSIIERGFTFSSPDCSGGRCVFAFKCRGEVRKNL